MKFILALFAILVTIGLSQAHQFPDFGKGPLHEDFQGFLDLMPVEKLYDVIVDYFENDVEVRTAIEMFLNSTLLNDFFEEFVKIPEVTIHFNYLRAEGIDVYFTINEINKTLSIKELGHVRANSIKKRTGGIAGYFKDIVEVLPLNDFIHLYVKKLKTSSAYIRYIDQLKSDNFQQLVNKVHKIEAFQIVLNGLKSKGVNTQIVADIAYIVLGITVPN